jgi:hypothetical protein
MVWWWIGNIIALVVVVPLVVFLASRVIRLGLEIRRYAADIREHGSLLDGNLEPVPALLETRDLAGRTRAAAVDYVEALHSRL